MPQKWDSLLFSSLFFILLFGFHSQSHGQGDSHKKYWIYFVDKGPETAGVQLLRKGSHLYTVAERFLNAKALWRRGKVLKEENLVDTGDLPVYQPYVDELLSRGIILHVSSRWFNAVSVLLSPDKVGSVASLPFVRKVVPVVTLFRDKEPIEKVRGGSSRSSLRKMQELNYGPSRAQVSVINVPAVHDLGINGTGVLIGMLDTGYRWKTHEALRNIRVIAERDFIFNDDNTADEVNDPPGQDSHGTSTLSTVGGFMPGQLIGPAYGASFILGKTEYVLTETQIEEDNWVAAIEWMESRGVDVVSSSLGYTTFDDGTGYSYSRGDFNGRTAVTTKAAVAAARKGVVVVNSMGNGGGVVGSIIAPADADSIISAGAVNLSGVRVSFSSIGPTNDGRIKPDLMAPGVGVYVASSSGSNSYGSRAGTSFSCPLAAGVASLVLSAHPEFTPIHVLDALRNTASRATAPDNFYGWGVINAKAALLSNGLVFSNVPQLFFNDSLNIIVLYAASNTGVDNLGMHLRYSLDGGRTFASLQMSPTTDSDQFLVIIPNQLVGTLVHYYIEGVDQGGIRRTNPYNAPDSLLSFRYGDGDTSRVMSTPILVTRPSNFLLYQNYPNPFNPSTTIQFYSPQSTDAEVTIYNTLGEKVKTLFRGKVYEGNNFFRWDGLGERGERVASGVYFYELRTPTFFQTKRMLLIK